MFSTLYFSIDAFRRNRRRFLKRSDVFHHVPVLGNSSKSRTGIKKEDFAAARLRFFLRPHDPERFIEKIRHLPYAADVGPRTERNIAALVPRSQGKGLRGGLGFRLIQKRRSHVSNDGADIRPASEFRGRKTGLLLHEGKSFLIVLGKRGHSPARPLAGVRNQKHLQRFFSEDTPSGRTRQMHGPVRIIQKIQPDLFPSASKKIIPACKTILSPAQAGGRYGNELSHVLQPPSVLCGSSVRQDDFQAFRERKSPG